MKKGKILKYIIGGCVIAIVIFLVVSLTGFMNREGQKEIKVNDVLITKSDIVANKKELTMINTTAEVLEYCVVDSMLEEIEPEQVLYTLRVRILSLGDTYNELDFKVRDVIKLYSKEELSPTLFNQTIAVNIQAEGSKYWINEIKRVDVEQDQLPPLHLIPQVPAKYAFPNLDSWLVELYEKHLMGEEAVLRFMEAHKPDPLGGGGLMTVKDNLVVVIIEPVDSDPTNIDRIALEDLGATIITMERKSIKAWIPINKLMEAAATVEGIDYIRPHVVIISA